MSDPVDGGGRLVGAINRFAYFSVLVVLASVAGLLWRSFPHRTETPRWPQPGIMGLTAVDGSARERWIVVVNPECSHCRERLAALGSALATRAQPPALGVLLVDAATRPDSLTGAARYPAGVWWDTAGAWRSRWGRHAYGEVLVFAPDGHLRRILPPDSSSAVRRP